MTSPVRNIVAGSLIAGAIAGLIVALTAGGANGWKYVLAAIGLALWVAGGFSKES